jgi:hypothetical protein
VGFSKKKTRSAVSCEKSITCLNLKIKNELSHKESKLTQKDLKGTNLVTTKAHSIVTKANGSKHIKNLTQDRFKQVHIKITGQEKSYVRINPLLVA